MSDSAGTVQQVTLSSEEQAVWNILGVRRGRSRAIGLDLVAIMSGVSERNVQHAIAGLIERHGRPIGSACTKPMGYFVIETEEELTESVSQLLHRLTALARRIAALKRCTTPVVLQQLALEMDQEAA